MIQTQEKSKKLHFGPDLGPLVSNLGRQFKKKKRKKFWLHQSLDIMINFHHVQYQKKLMIQS